MSDVFPIIEDPRFRLSTATGGETVFSVPFPFQANADIAVIRERAGVELELDEGTHYSLTGAGSPSGGTVTLATSALAGDRYTRVGRAILDRKQSVTRGGQFKSKAIDDDLDRWIIIAQELARDSSRSFKAKLGARGGAVLPGAAGSLVQSDGFGNLVEGPSAADVANAKIYAEAAKGAAAAAQAIGGNAYNFSSRTIAAAYVPPDEVPPYTRTAGFGMPGDGGGALYVLVDAATVGGYADGAGNFYACVPETGVLNPFQFGATADGQDSLNSLQTLIAVADALKLPIDLLDKTWTISNTLEHTWSSKPRIVGHGAVIKLNRSGGAVVGYAVRHNVGVHGFDCRGWLVDANDEAYCGLSFHGPSSMANVGDGFGEDIGAVNVLRLGTDFVGGFGLWVYNGFNRLKLVRPLAHNIRVAAGADVPSSIGAHGIAVTGSAEAESRFVEIIDPDVDGVYSLDTDLNTDQDGILLFGIPPTATSRPLGYARIVGGTIKNARGRGVKMARQNGLVEGTHFERDGADGFYSRGLMDIDFQQGEGVVRDITYRHTAATAEAIVSSSAQANVLAADLVIDGVRGWIDPAMANILDCIVRRTYSSGGHAPSPATIKNVDHTGRFISNAVRIATALDSVQEYFDISDVRIQTLGNAMLRVEGGVSSAARISINRCASGNEVALINEFSGTALWSGGRNQGMTEPSFYGSLTGMTTVPVTTVLCARDNDIVTLTFGSASGVSNATTMTMNGLPTRLHPTSDRTLDMVVVDNGTRKAGYVIVSTTGAVTFFPDVNFGDWTASGLKGFPTKTVTYNI